MDLKLISVFTSTLFIICGKPETGHFKYTRSTECTIKGRLFTSNLQITKSVIFYLNISRTVLKKQWNLYIPQLKIQTRTNLLLILAGDIELNPGPRNNKCGSCHKIVRFSDKAIKCDDCGHWIHNRCSSTDDSTYTRL